MLVAKESVKSFDCCSLTLQPCANPVITKDGYLFDKEAILSYIISKKNEYSRKMKEFEKQKQSDEQDLADIAAAENKKKLEAFIKTEKNIQTSSPNGEEMSLKVLASYVCLILDQQAGPSRLSNMLGDKASKLPAFWCPSQTPDSGKAKLQKPDSTIYCPVSGEPFKAKDLIDVRFTLADPNDKTNLAAKEHPYVCAVSRDVLTNSCQLAVLRPTGDVVTMDCVEKVIKKDWIHPLTNEKLTEKDIILLQRGGTGFSSVNDILEAKSKQPAQQC